MSTEQDPCIRGCRRPCGCDECKATDEPQHQPVPAMAQEGLLCKRDANRLYKWLTTALDDTARLDTRIPVDYGWDKEGGHQKVSGSPALIRLDVAALTDPRSSFGVTNTGTPGNNPGDYPENRDPNPPVDIPGEVMMWARMFTEEQELTSAVDTMSRAIDVLTAWWEVLIAKPWVDDFYNGMSEIRQQLNRANNVERPKPMGHCFTCEAAMYSRPGMSDVRCGQCGRRYDGLDLVKLEVQRRREATA